MTLHRLRSAVPALLFTTLLAGCATKSINAVLADPGRYRNREVKLAGSVVDSYSLASRGVYRIEDRDGHQLWVVSDHGVPRTGAHVTVKGTVREGFNLGNLGDRLPRGVGTGLVLMEDSHKASR
ncbi:MAG: hypothetical protein ABI051_16200 [Vicinamibacterales bacterium]